MTDRLIPANYNGGAESACCITHVRSLTSDGSVEERYTIAFEDGKGEINELSASDLRSLQRLLTQFLTYFVDKEGEQ